MNGIDTPCARVMETADIRRLETARWGGTTLDKQARRALYLFARLRLGATEFRSAGSSPAAGTTLLVVALVATMTAGAQPLAELCKDAPSSSEYHANAHQYADDFCAKATHSPGRAHIMLGRWYEERLRQRQAGTATSTATINVAPGDRGGTLEAWHDGADGRDAAQTGKATLGPDAQALLVEMDLRRITAPYIGVIPVAERDDFYNGVIATYRMDGLDFGQRRACNAHVAAVLMGLPQEPMKRECPTLSRLMERR